MDDAKAGQLTEMLIAAARTGDLARAKEMLAAGADPKRKGWQGLTALHAAAGRASRDECASLLASVSDGSARDQDGQTALMVAAASGLLGALWALLPWANPADADALGRTALMKAARLGRVGCAEALAREAGALARDANGETALMMAAASGASWAKECVEAIAAAGGSEMAGQAGWTALMHAAAASERAALEGHADGGAGAVEALARLPGLEARNENGSTALGIAAANGSFPALLALLEAGADAKALDSDGRSPLMCAASRGAVGMVKALLPLSDVGARDAQGLDALGHAAKWGRSWCEGEIAAWLAREAEAKEIAQACAAGAQASERRLRI